ncbi:MAG: SBBP repeat-containing protein [Byssovorax sp.]
MGEVVPQPEICATPEDEDCDGKAPPCKGVFAWAEVFGDAGHLQFGTSIAVDSAGSVLVTGSFYGSVDFGGGLLTSAGGRDIFVAKFNALGVHQWSKSFGGAADQLGWSIAVDSMDSVLVMGDFEGSIDFGGKPLVSAGSGDIFVVKLDMNGVHQWSKSFGDGMEQAGRGVAVDSAGDVLLTGSFTGSVNFGGSSLTSVNGRDVFVAKLDSSSGAHLWSKRFGGTTAADDGAGQSVAVDSARAVLLTGSFAGSVDFGGGLAPSAGGRDIFVVKLDANGAYQWSKSFGDGEDQLGASIAVDSMRSVLVTGDFNGDFSFGGAPPTLLKSGGNGDIFVAKLDLNGAHQWSKSFGDAADQAGKGVAVDSADDVLLTGSFSGFVDFGGGQLPSAGNGDIFLAKFDGKGGHQWSKRFGDADYQSGASIAVDSAGNVLLTGVIAGTVEFGGGPVVSAGERDVFVAKFGP